MRNFKKHQSRKGYQASLRTSSSSSCGEGQPYVSRRAQKNRLNLLNYNVHNRLRIAGTLTLSEWPDGLQQPLRGFIKRLKYQAGARFPWSAVAEVGEFGQPHWHLCLPDSFEQETLETCWDSTSVTDFRLLETKDDVAKWSWYMGKTFDLPIFERLTHRRFHSGPGYYPRPLKYEMITKAEAIRLVEEQAQRSGSEITEWDGPNAWCPKAYFWNVNF